MEGVQKFAVFTHTVYAMAMCLSVCRKLEFYQNG